MQNTLQTFRPQTTDIKYGPEPNLVDILVHFYTSHGIEYMKARQIAYEYLAKLEQELKKE